MHFAQLKWGFLSRREKTRPGEAVFFKLRLHEAVFSKRAFAFYILKSKTIEGQKRENEEEGK